jgi:hypothetical protein
MRNLKVFKKIFPLAVILFFTLTATLVYSGYHHMGEKDLSRFLKLYPDKKNTKLDSCALLALEAASGVIIDMAMT